MAVAHGIAVSWVPGSHPMAMGSAHVATGGSGEKDSEGGSEGLSVEIEVNVEVEVGVP